MLYKTVRAFAVLLIAVMHLPAWTATSVEAPPHQIKSAMIFKMLPYISWPDEQNLSAVHLAFIGNEQALYQELVKAAKKISIKGKPLTLTKADANTLDAGAYQVIYVSESNNHQLAQLTNNIRRTDTLLISNKAQNRRDLMVNFLTVEAGGLTFEVNRTNIIFEKLTIDRDLLLFGGTEMDVAELFRESEHSLQQIKSALHDNESQLKTASLQLKQDQQLIKNQISQISSFKQEIVDKSKVINNKEKQITTKEKQLQQRHLELNQLTTQVQQVAQDLQNKQTELAGKTSQNSQQQALLDDQETKFGALTEQIAEKQHFLAAQQARITSLGGQVNEQHGTIASQKKTLWITIAILAVFMVLILMTLRSNASRRRSNEKLKQSRANMVLLGDIGRELTSTRDLHQIMEQVYQSLSGVLDTHVFLMGVLKEEENHIHVGLIIENKQYLPEYNVDLGDDTKPAVWCIKQQSELVINNSDDQLKYFKQNLTEPEHGEPMETVIYQPLVIHDKVVGCLSLQSPKAHAYNSEQLEMIRTLSGYTAVAMANALGYTELEQQKLKVEQKSLKIVATQKQLVQSEKMASLGTLTAGVAHEINNPTNFTHAAIYMMHNEVEAIKAFLKQLAGGDNADPKVLDSFEDHFADLMELIDTAAEGARRIMTIVNNLQSFTRLDNTEQKESLIGDLVESTVRLVQTQYDEITIDSQLSFNPPITCYPAKLSQVLMNLIVNACQAIQSERRRSTPKKGHVQITTEQSQNQLKISVKDNGCGMSEVTQQRIFEPFYTTKDVGSGTGLGMAISFGIIEEHDGSIEIESAEGEGSVISICLPL